MDEEQPPAVEIIQPDLASKNWKARQAAYTQMQLDSPDILEAIKKVPMDSNQVAQESGVELLVKISEQQYFTPTKLIEKCLSSSRIGIRSKAVDVLVNLSKFEQQAVIEGLLAQFGAKLPRLVASAVGALNRIALNGLPAELKPIFKALPSLFTHSDASVRTEAQMLTVTLYRWIQSIDLFESSLFPQLRDVQVKELQEAFQSAEPFHQPTNELKSDPVKVDLSEPVDVLNKLPKNLESKLNEPKWSDRKEVMEDLLKVLDTPQYVHDRPFNQLLNLLAKKVSDIHLVVSGLAVDCVQKVALGLGKEFAQYKHLVLASLLERLKEKKLTNSLRSCLDAVFQSLNGIGDVLNELVEAAFNKNPLMRSEVALYVQRCLSVQKQPVNKSDSKVLITFLSKLVTDSVPEVRDGAMKALGSLLKLNGDSVLAMLFDVDQPRLDKIKEYANVGKENVSKPIASKPVKSEAPKKKRPVSRLAKTTQVKPTSVKPVQQLATTSVKIEEEQVKYYWTEESALEQAEAVFGLDVVTGLSDSVWKTRLEAVQSLQVKINETLSIEHLTEFVVVLLKSRSVWKDSNFQVMNLVVVILQSMAADMSRSAAQLCLPLLLEKTADNKVKLASVTVLKLLTEKFGCGVVLNELPQLVKAQKSPKNISEILKAATELLKDYGTAGVNIKSLVQMCKEQITSPNQLIRSSVVGLLTIMRIHVGPAIRDLLDDVSPAQLNVIDTEFAKVADAPKPIVHSTQASESVHESLIDRVDLKIPAAVVAELGNSNWKMRKESLDAIQNLLKECRYCINTPNPDLITALKQRLQDANKILVAQTLEVFGQLAKSVGHSIERLFRPYISDIVACLNDNKVAVRQAAIKCLDEFKSVVSNAFVLDLLLEGLKSQSASVKQELLDWMTANSTLVTPEFIQRLAKSYDACFQDKNQDVRKSAQKLLAVLVESVGVSTLDKFLQTNALDAYRSKPKSPLINKRMSRTGTPSKASSKASLTIKPVFPLLLSDSKDKRAKQDSGQHKWNYDPARSDLVSFLADQSQGCFTNEFQELLFANDAHKEKSHLQALTTLDAIVTGESTYDLENNFVLQAVLSQVDIILKYLSVRLYDTNTTMVLKCLELTTHLFEMCDNVGYHLSDYEASSILPASVVKSGDAKDTLRQKVRLILSKLACRVYPVSKVCVYLLKGLSDKNAKARIECLYTLASLVTRNGVHILGQLSKSVPLIASQVADSSVRNSSIQCLVCVHELIGDQLYQYVRELSDRDIGFIKDKIKRTSDTPQKSRPTSQDQVRASLISLQSNSDKDNIGSNESLQAPRPTQRKFSLELDTLNLAPTHSLISPDVVSLPSGTLDSTFTMDLLITQIGENIYQATDALKKLERLIHDDYQQVLPQLNQLVIAITLQVRLAFTSPVWSSGADYTSLLRLCKHLINALVQMFSNAHLARQLEKSTMNPLMSEIITHLNVPVTAKEAGQQLTRALNVLMLKILDLCDKNDVVQTLLDLLESSYEKVDGNETEEKYANLVMKCIWKLTRQLGELIRTDGIRVGDLLLSLHRFLCRIPPNEWKLRGQQKKPLTDMPYRTMKTIIHEIALSAGESAVQEMLNIPELPDPEKSVVYSYLSSMVSQAKGSSLPVPSQPSSASVSAPVAVMPTVSPVIATPVKPQSQVAVGLDQIFAKFDDKDKANDAVQELKVYLKYYPQSRQDVDKRLQSFGTHFRSFVTKQLDEVPTTPAQTNDSDIYKQRLSRLKEQMASTTPQKQLSTPEMVPRSTDVDSIKSRLAKMRANMSEMGLK